MKKLGLLFLFIGIILTSIFMFFDFGMTFEVWLIGFLVSMAISAAGFVLLIFDLARAIKAEKRFEI
ncbi:hypothetical protein ACOQFO_01630 [Ureibacillus sp. MALMAid1270]|uniref:hypothetical protein n=1 Tax=Ureibacillus sp. MALMAid1270 TaxID=3411629 RepID=UPI003BA45ADD